MKRFLLLLIACIALLPALTAAQPAARTVGDRFEITVTWMQTPVILGDTTGMRMTITENGEPVTGAQLDASVTFMEAVRVLNLQEVDAGVYTGVFIPMQPGEYSFTISGTIDGVEINETFAAADGLAQVQPRTDYEFPNAAHGFNPITLAAPVAASALLGAAIWFSRRQTR